MRNTCNFLLLAGREACTFSATASDSQLGIARHILIKVD